MPVEYVFFVVFGLFAASLLFKVIKHGGLRGAMFGAPVGRMISEMQLEKRGMVKTKLKIHLLDPREPAFGPHVGVEVIQSTFGSWEMKPITLSREEAQQLADHLMVAARESANGSARSR